ncbi:MAG: flagellin [Thermodesulfobacteriota bacterium]
MAYDISLTQGMRANLISLQLTTKLLGATQNRLSTGKKVNTAMDDPVNFFAAQSHMTRASDLAARKDGMSEAIQIVTAGDKGITAINTLIEQAKGIATSALATTDASSRASYATQYNTVMSQIITMAADSGYKGTNLLNGGSVDVKFNEDGSSKLNVSGFGATTLANMQLTVVNGAFTTDIGINSAISRIGSASEILRTTAKTLAANLNVITTRQDFTKDMIDTLKTGADNLTLADMNEESANMLMLQTRQSLGTTSLGIASQAAQSVLRLFG